MKMKSVYIVRVYERATGEVTNRMEYCPDQMDQYEKDCTIMDAAIDHQKYYYDVEVMRVAA